MAVGKSEGEGGEEGEKPWSREEEVLGRVRRMEEEETGLGSGTRGRRAHLDLDEEGGKGMVVEEGARGELRGLRDGGRGLVMLVCFYPFFTFSWGVVGVREEGIK